jgi:DNA-binding IclR family transcriptional regulator
MTNKNIKKKETTDKMSVVADIIARLAHARSDTTFGISELARELSKNKFYIIRLLSSLESIGWVSQDQVTRRYKIGNGLVNIGLLLASHLYLPKIALPYLYELSEITDETSVLSVRIGYEHIFVQQVPVKHYHHQTVTLGKRNPLWLGASGKSMAAYLSNTEIDELVNIMARELPAFKGLTLNTDQYRNDLEEIKKRGYAITVGDYLPDICSLAAPIFGKDQTAIGALIVRGKSPHFDPNSAEAYSSVLIEKTLNITREIQDLT